VNETTPENETRTGPLGGLLKSLTQVLVTLVSMAQTRLELVTAELQEEVQRAALLLVWAFVAVLAAGIGLFLGAMSLIFAFWETHRGLVSVLVTGAFFLIALIAALNLRRQLRAKPRLFDATLTELAEDRQRLERRLREAR